MQIWPGKPYPLGATFDGAGTNFSVFSEVAERVELCLFDDEGSETRVDLPGVHRALLARLPARACGPGSAMASASTARGRPTTGHWCNPSKLLLDPYAKAIDGLWDWNEAIFPYHFSDPENSKNDLDSAPFVPRASSSTRSSTGATIAARTRPGTARSSTKRTSRASPKRIPTFPRSCAARYAGMAHPVAVEYLQSLGITAVELLPVHQFVQDSTLARQGPAQLLGLQLDRLPRAAQRVLARGQRGEQVQEFKQLVKTLHEAGIEVILDVVYNHTAEGNHLGPMLSFKGIDNAAYYRLDRRTTAATTWTTPAPATR